MTDYRFDDNGADLQAIADYYEQRARDQAQAATRPQPKPQASPTKAPESAPCEHSYNGRHSWVFQDPKDPDHGTCRYQSDGCSAEVNSPEPPRMRFNPNPLWNEALDDAYGNIRES